MFNDSEFYNELNDEKIISLRENLINYNEFDLTAKKSLTNSLCDVLNVCNSNNLVKNLNKFSMQDVNYLVQNASIALKNFGYENLNTNYELFTEYDPVFSLKKKEIIGEYQSMYRKGLILDGDQKEFIDFFSQHRRVLLSAPTSFGKTFLLEEIIQMSDYQNVVMIFPLNALLNENLEKFDKLNQKLDNPYLIKTRPVKGLDLVKDKHLFILTPERFNQLVSLYADLKIDFAFMDEIYKIDNEFSDDSENIVSRDAVFRIALMNLAKKSKDFYLAGPYLSKELFESGFKNFLDLYKIRLKIFKTEKVKKISYKEKGNKNKSEKIIEILSRSPIRNKNENFLIYVRGEKTLFNVSSLLKNAKLPILSEYSENCHPDVKLFCAFLRKNYSKNSQIWILPWYLECGIGLHCGNFPKYIQAQILSFFNDKKIKVLVCTTSITEGVNVSARNLIFYDSQKGNRKLSKFDVKNIEGRAGRYYHHFIGRIYTLTNNIEAIKQLDDLHLDFVNFSPEKDMSNVDIVNTDFSNLLQDRHRKRKQDLIDLAKGNKIPLEVLNKNSTIDWIDQFEIIKKIRNLEIEDQTLLKEGLISPHYSKKFNQAFLKIISLLNETVQEIRENNKRRRLYAIFNQYSHGGFDALLSYWMDEQRIKIDPALMTCFNDERNVMHYLLPKYFNVFANCFGFLHDMEIPDSFVTIGRQIKDEDEWIRWFDMGFPAKTLEKIKLHKITYDNLAKVLDISEFSEYEKKIIEKRGVL